MALDSVPILPGRCIRDDKGNVVEVEPPQPCPELLTEEEAVRFLRLDGEKGPSDPYQTLWRYRREGLLRAVKIGRQLRYPREELMRFIRRLTEGCGRGSRVV